MLIDIEKVKIGECIKKDMGLMIFNVLTKKA